jgi:hypothetical protein
MAGEFGASFPDEAPEAIEIAPVEDGREDK